MIRRFECLVLALGLLYFGCGENSSRDTFGGNTLLSPDSWGNCDPSEIDSRHPFISCVEEFSPARDASTNHDLMPEIVLGGPRGAGDSLGSLDVVSLGCGGSITVFFDPPIVNGLGMDFIIFENPFLVGTSDQTFAEPAQVSVSPNRIDWYSYPCEIDQGWPPSGCAGIHPVYAHRDNDLDPTDPIQAGGDSFDLEESGFHAIRYIRLDDKTEEYFGSRMYCGASGGFDLDAMVARYP